MVDFGWADSQVGVLARTFEVLDQFGLPFLE